MAVTDYATYLNLIKQQPISLLSKQCVGDISRFQSSFTQGPVPATAPTTATALSNSSAGAITFQRLGLPSSTTKTRRLAQIQSKGSNSAASNITTTVLIDRLSHQGGLSGTTTGAQTTNLPTAALTRYTSGEGVFAALEIYTTVGTTATTATVSYTNQAGTAGLTSKDFVFGGTSNRTAGTMLIIPLADGDTGVRSVESVTLAASTTTAGNFGVTLFKILDWVPAGMLGNDQVFGPVDAFLGGGGLCPVVEDNACLQLVTFANSANPVIVTSLRFIEDDV